MNSRSLRRKQSRQPHLNSNHDNAYHDLIRLIIFRVIICIKQEKRETSTVPKTEDRLRRLTEENKKLIHLVTSLDQQVALLENKLTAGLTQGEEQRQRQRHSSSTAGEQNVF